MRKYAFAFITLLCSSHLVAQTWYPGGFVNNQGDSVKGFILLTESNFNPNSIKFKATSQSIDEIKHTIDDIQSFWYDFGERYVRYEVFVSMDYVDLAKIVTPPLPKPVEETILLKEIATGKHVTLYSYQDDIKKRFYYQKSRNTNPQELPFSIIKMQSGDVQKLGRWVEYKFKYRDVLTALANESENQTPKLRSKIKRAQYRAVDIISIINDINGSDPEVLPRTKGGRTLTLGLGAMNAQYKFMDNSELSKNGTASPGIGIWASAGYDMLTNPRVGKFVVRTRLQLSVLELSADTYDKRYVSSAVFMNHEFRQIGLAAQISALYNLTSSNKFKPFVGLGVRANFWKNDYEFVITTVSSTTTTVSNSSRGEPRKLGVGIPLTTGILLKKRLEISATYLPTIRLSAWNARYKYGISTLEAGITWHLPTERPSDK